MHTTAFIMALVPGCKNSWRIISLMNLVTIVITVSLSHQCKAQCSDPTAHMIASPRYTELLYSPNHPEPYPDGTSCAFRIVSPSFAASGRIEIRVKSSNFSCCCDTDYLVLRDGINSEARPIAKLCSDINPISVTSSGNYIYGEFRSNNDGKTGLGYILEYNNYNIDSGCPSGWLGRDEYCYKLYNDSLPWQQAASRCGYDSGFLTSIANESENTFLVDSFGNQSLSAWIGLDINGNWIDGTISSLYTNFIDGSATTTGCSAIDLKGNGGWRVYPECDEQELPFICKKSRNGTGGRYWTHVSFPEEESGFNASSLIGIFIFAFIFFISCTRGMARNNNNSGEHCCVVQLFCNILVCFGKCFDCLCGGIGKCLGCVCSGIEDICNAVSRAFSYIIECKCLAQNDNAGTEQNEVSVEEARTSPNNAESSRRATPSSPSPPAYGDVTTEQPPPSYEEALSNPTYQSDGTTVSNGDLEAPSYESVLETDARTVRL